MRDERDKTIVGYCEPLSLRAGERVTLHASSDVEAVSYTHLTLPTNSRV